MAKSTNTGKDNTGENNSGDWNSGHWNSGYGNSTNRETGIFNTTESTLRMFNKPTNKKWDDIDHPDFDEFYLNKWIPESEMTEAEKKADLYQLMLSLVGEDELYYRPYLVATTKITTSQNQTQARMVLRNRNKLRAELRAKLSEHFNGEGQV